MPDDELVRDSLEPWFAAARRERARQRADLRTILDFKTRLDAVITPADLDG